MTIEEAIKELEEKYGEDFNWAIISDSKIFFVNELKSELSNDDVVKNVDVIALARSYSNDDVLFLIENKDKKVYRIYHLTYSKCNAKGFPRYIKFEDINSIREYLEKEFILDFIEI